MELYEKHLSIPVVNNHIDLLDHFQRTLWSFLQPNEALVRFAVTETTSTHYSLEVGICRIEPELQRLEWPSIFAHTRREVEASTDFNAVLLIPTGIGAELGGHAGDSGALARAMAGVCDTLITHPNVVNASDINELPDNGLYVEGSLISRLLMGQIGLQKVRSNRILVLLDDHDDPNITEHSINAVSAGRATMGIDCPEIIKMDRKTSLWSEYSESGRAVGRIENLENILTILEDRRPDYDAVAISTVIGVPKHFHHEYYLGGMVNPWGGVEAMLTHAISSALNIPSAHSPMMESEEIMNLNLGVVDPRMAAEVVSVAYLHSVLKGLSKSPRVIRNRELFPYQDVLSSEDISCLVVPDGCLGIPVIAALEQGIPVIAVKENTNLMRNQLHQLPFSLGNLYIVDNYLEALGVMTAIREGISLESVRRPLGRTRVSPELQEELAEEFGNVVRFKVKREM